MKKKKLSSSRKERIQPERHTLFPQKVYHFNLVLGEIVEEPLYKPPITFIPRRDCESSTEGGTIVFTYVFSPEGTAKAVPKVVQLFLRMFYFWVGNVYWTIKIRIFHRPF